MTAPSAPGILLVLPWPIGAAGGVNQVVANLIRAGRRTGRTRPVLVENTATRGSTVTADGPDGAPVLRFWLRTPLDPAAPMRTLAGFLLRLPATVAVLRTLIKTHQLDCINVHYPTLAALHFRVLGLLGRRDWRLVLSFHGLDIHAAAGSTGLTRLAWRWLIRGADAIVACSAALAAEVAAFEPRCRPRLSVIHNGVDPTELPAAAGRLSAPPELAGRHYVLNVATFEPKKGQDVLLAAFASLAPDFPALDLVLAGRETAHLGSLRAQVESLGLVDRVFIYTDVPHERLAPLFAGARAFCLPSRAEPFGIVLLEAALFGLPVLASAVGGVTEIVQPGRDGTLVPPDDVPALRTALRTVLAHPDEARRQADSLRERVLAEFTWDSALTRYLALAR